MRKLLIGAAALTAMAVLFPVYALPMALWPTTRWRLRMGSAYARRWSQFFLFLGGVRLQVEGMEHMRNTCPAVFLFNHTNLLDFFVNAVIAPYTALVWGKRELVRFPFLGWMWWLSGHPMIDRKNREQWQVVMDQTAARMATGHFTTFIAPEGTRSRDGKLLPFKKGPFHLALKAKAPLVCVVIHGAQARYTKAGPIPGVCRVEILPPIPVDDWDPARLDEHVAEVRQRYVEALGPVQAPV